MSDMCDPNASYFPEPIDEYENCEQCDQKNLRSDLMECKEGYYCPSCLEMRRLNVGKKGERGYLA